MKRKTLLRRIAAALFVLALFCGMLFTLTSCEPPPPPIPECEKYHEGTVTVENSTGYSIWTDVTWGNVVENYEKLLYNGNSYKYTQVPASGHPDSNGGTIEIWVSFDGQDWSFNYENLSPCENMTYTWYLSARKAANGCPFVVIDSNGKEHIPTLKSKN